MPSFWLGLLARDGLRPLGALVATDRLCALHRGPVDWLRSLVLPGLALGASASAAIARQTRSALVEVLQRDYITAARARGMSFRRVFLKHGQKNASGPAADGRRSAGRRSARWQRGGRAGLRHPWDRPLAITSVSRRDLSMIQGIVVLSAVVVVLVNLVIDLLYGWVNPKARVR